MDFVLISLDGQEEYCANARIPVRYIIVNVRLIAEVIIIKQVALSNLFRYGNIFIKGILCLFGLKWRKSFYIP